MLIVLFKLNMFGWHYFHHLLWQMNTWKTYNGPITMNTHLQQLSQTNKGTAFFTIWKSSIGMGNSCTFGQLCQCLSYFCYNPVSWLVFNIIWTSFSYYIYSEHCCHMFVMINSSSWLRFQLACMKFLVSQVLFSAWFWSSLAVLYGFSLLFQPNSFLVFP